MPRSDETPPPAGGAIPHADGATPPAAGATPPAPVSRRRFLTQVAAVAATAPAIGALVSAAAHDEALAATRTHTKHAPAPAKPPTEAPAAAGPRPDFSVAKTPAEREALEKQWKQMTDLVQALRKTPVPVGAEFATGALAPRKLRREAN